MFRKVFMLACLFFTLAVSAQSMILSETYSGANDSTYNPLISIDLRDQEQYPDNARFVIWLRTLGGTYAPDTTTTSKYILLDVLADSTYYVKVQSIYLRQDRGRVYQYTTPFDECPESAIKIWGNSPGFFNLRVANNIIYPSTVPIFKGITFLASGDTVFWSAGTLMYDEHVYEIVSGNTGGLRYAYWPGADSTHFGASDAQPALSVWTVAGIDSATSDLYITESHKQIWGEVIRAGTITANQIAAGTITADRFAVAVWDSVDALADSAGVSWGNINGVPAELAGSVSSTGVYILPDYIGFYDDGTSSWPIRINNDSGTGKFYAGAADTSSYIDWNGTTMTMKGRFRTAASGQRVEISNVDNTMKFYKASDTVPAITIDDAIGGGSIAGILVNDGIVRIDNDSLSYSLGLDYDSMVINGNRYAEYSSDVLVFEKYTDPVYLYTTLSADSLQIQHNGVYNYLSFINYAGAIKYQVQGDGSTFSDGDAEYAGTVSADSVSVRSVQADEVHVTGGGSHAQLRVLNQLTGTWVDLEITDGVITNLAVEP